MDKFNVAILVGSDSDLPTIAAAAKVFNELGVSWRVNVASAHRTPEKVREIVREAESQGVEVFIAGAGMAAALPGVVAAETLRPVIGVPMEGKALAGMDALFSIVQMPPGIPVACTAVGRAGATNAAILAAQILAVKDGGLREKLAAYRRRMADAVNGKDAELRKLGLEKYLEANSR